MMRGLNYQSVLLFLSCLFTLTSTLAVTGATGGINTSTGQRPFRQEINTFQKSGAAFDLYIQALQQFQASAQTGLSSWYQVAGIHGRPFIAWDGATAPRPFGTGYCTHSSILFPPWHRPYVALFEQTLWGYAKTIAATYPTSNRAAYQAAALTFRIPYWDWALNATMPPVVSLKTVSITTPTGKKSVANPLLTYTFHPRPSASDFPPGELGAEYPNTVRYPDSKGNSQPNLVNQQLAANADDIHDRTYLLLSQQTNYAAFSTTGFVDSSGDTTDSLENIHNEIHTLVGNGGHMTYVPYAGFDPIFWLHHANVDRMFSIWQALYPNSYVTPLNDPFGTYTIAPNTVENVNTPLTPFHSGTGSTFWTSTTARSTKSFGYSYPEVVDWGVTAAKLTSNTKAAVKKLYDPTGSLSRRSFGALPERAVAPLSVDNSLKSGDKNTGSYDAWYIKLEVDEYELNEPFFIHFFDGEFSDDPSQWSFDKNLISSFSVFTPSNTSSRPSWLVYSQVPLVRRLVLDYNDGLLDDLQPKHVIPYLKENLHWRVQSLKDEAIPTESLTSLKIHVVHQKVTPTSKADEFPSYGKYTPYLNATDGKQGSYRGRTPPAGRG